MTLEHSHLTEFDKMTISINVHDEGNTLEVVGMCCKLFINLFRTKNKTSCSKLQ